MRKDYLRPVYGSRIAVLSFAITVVAALLSPGARGDERNMKPFAVIDRALLRWRARPRPLQLSYVVEFAGHNKNRVFRRKFKVEVSVPDHATHVTMLDSQGAAPPFVRPEKPRFLATESFGFVPPDAALAPPTTSPAPDVPIIAAVHANVHYPYDVRLVGFETIGERSAYHLQLDPRQAPDAYPLRELWIDASTYDVLQVIAQQIEHLGPIAIPYRVNARYAEQGPYWLIAHVESGANIRAGLFSYGTSADADFHDFQYAP